MASANQVAVNWSEMVRQAQALEAALVEQTVGKLRAADADKFLSGEGRAARHKEALALYVDVLTQLDAKTDGEMEKGVRAAQAVLDAAVVKTTATERLEQRMLAQTLADALPPAELRAELMKALGAGATVQAVVLSEEVPLRLQAMARRGVAGAEAQVVGLAQEVEAWRDRVKPERVAARETVEAIRVARTELQSGRMGRTLYGQRHRAFAALPGHVGTEAGMMHWTRQGSPGGDPQGVGTDAVLSHGVVPGQGQAALARGGTVG
ncbi:MAG TPA: hypothetical protein PLD23_07935 [Armatimonadota bacterium]|nr:hypothetical protein [Armatimonadota bacterium]HQK93421.1 hypothetical protein [Armatimonadota bacterium]